MDPVALDVPPALRELTAAEAPFPGTLRTGEPPTVWVDAEEFAASPAWAAVGAEHVLAPLDTAGTSEGPRVILPHCPVRLDEVLAGDATAGALVTVAVSALRGAVEADTLGAAAGWWWVTAEGRPVLALTGSTPWRDDTVDLLRRADAADPALRQALDNAATAVADPRLLRREAEAIEAALFAAADAEPLPTEPRDHAVAPSRRDRIAMPPRATRGIVAMAHDLIARLVDVGIADRIARAWSAVTRRPRRLRRARKDADGRRPPGRRRVIFVAAAVATAVIVVGALWPSTDDERPAAAAGGTAGDPAATRPAASGGQTPTPEGAPDRDAGPAEIVDAARGLVDALRGCDEASCREALWEDPGAAGPIAAATEDYAVEVVDEYGGAAAVRLVTSEVTQVLVMVRVEKRWLVREVYDLADQP